MTAPDIDVRAIERALPPWARIIAAIVVVALVAFAGWWIFVRPVTAHREAAQAKTDAKLDRTTADIATQAIPIVNDAARQRVEVDVHVSKGTADVRAAPDASVEVRGVSDALRRNLCLSGAYAADPACQPVRQDPAGVGTARAN